MSTPLLTSRSFSRSPMEYLDDKNIQAIQETTYRILEEIGSDVLNEEARDLLLKGGAKIIEGNRFSIPRKMVLEAVESAPSSVTLFDRNGEPSMVLEKANTYFGTGSDCPNLFDPFKQERRLFLSDDIPNAVKLVDALPNLDFTMSNGLGSDLNTEHQYQIKYSIMVRNTTKPQVITAANAQCLDDIANIASAFRANRAELSEKPMFLLYAEPTSPLVHTDDAVGNMLFMAENRFPVNYSPGMMAGASGPVTVAGAIALANAEILAGLVIHQLKNAGAPFVFGAGMSPLDMKSCQPSYSAPEAMMAQAGLCQIARELHKLPTWGFGGCSASKLPDQQAANEASQYILMAAQMGTNVVHDVGYLEFGLTYSYNMLVMCDEFIGQARRMAAGIAVDDEHLAFDAIKRVGQGGHYLADDHTLNHFRNNWMPGITDRMTFEQWTAKGGSTMLERSTEKIKDILENHKQQPVSDEANKKIDEVLNTVTSR